MKEKREEEKFDEYDKNALNEMIDWEEHIDMRKRDT